MLEPLPPRPEYDNIYGGTLCTDDSGALIE